MPNQTIWQQILTGAAFGLIALFTARLQDANAAYMLSAEGLGAIFGSIVGGAALYAVLYRILPKK